MLNTHLDILLESRISDQIWYSLHPSKFFRTTAGGLLPAGMSQT